MLDKRRNESTISKGRETKKERDKYNFAFSVLNSKRKIVSETLVKYTME